MKPRVSIVMPSYNSHLYIGEALDSLVSQSFADFEILIIDDSVDSIASIVEGYGDSRLKLTENKTKVGVSAARNQGIAQAAGEFIAFHDADDISKPGRFEKQLVYFDAHPKVAMLGGGREFLELDNSIEQEKLRPKSPSLKYLQRNNCFRTSSVVLRAEALHQVGGFKPQLAYAEDWELWIRIAQKFQVANLRQVLYTHRRTIDGITAREHSDHILWDTLVYSIGKGYVGDNELQIVGKEGIKSFSKMIPKAAQFYYHRKLYGLAKTNDWYEDAAGHAIAIAKCKPLNLQNWFRVARSSLRAWRNDGVDSQVY